MLKLFRRVRQKLLEEGSLKRYLLYAIGEILLVMIGILLALQVSNWNQKRVDDKKELKALMDLSKEFQLNAERIKTKQNLRISIAPKLASYIELVAAGEANYEAYKEFHQSPFMFGMTNPQNGVIDALISSGEIALISNDSLKYFLADWKNQAENLYENEQILWDSGIQYIESAADKIPFPSHNWKDWDDNKLALAYENLSKSIVYRNNLVGFEGVNNIVIEECEEVLLLLEKVSIFLDKEIKKHQIHFQ